MDMLRMLPAFDGFQKTLNKAGVMTKSARGFWGGVTDTGEIVVTSWTDANDGNGRFYIWKPKTNHGGLKIQWEVGSIKVGTEVKLILLKQKKNLPLGEPGRQIGGAALMPGKWRVAELVRYKDWQAVVERAD